MLDEELTPAQIKVYTDFRKNKGEVGYEKGRIFLTVIHPLDRLYEMKVIDEAMQWAGFEFCRIVDKMTILASLRNFAEESTHQAKTYPLDALIAINRALKPWERQLVRRLCVDAMRESDYKWAYRIKSNIQEAFESLEKVLASMA